MIEVNSKKSIEALQKIPDAELERLYDQYGNPRWPYLNLFTWKRLNFKCRQCSWSGDGGQVDIGEVDDEITELVCPDCGAYMSALSHLVEIPGFNKES